MVGRGGGDGDGKRLRQTFKYRKIWPQLHAGPVPDRGDDASLKPDTNMEGRPDTEAETSWWIGSEFKSSAVYRSLICFTLDSVDITMCYFSHSSLTLDQKDFSFLFVKPDSNLSFWLPSQNPHI